MRSLSSVLAQLTCESEESGLGSRLAFTGRSGTVLMVCAYCYCWINEDS